MPRHASPFGYTHVVATDMEDEYASTADAWRSFKIERWADDWRVGAVVYQVIVDRFAQPDAEDLQARAHLYPSPKKLRSWDEVPTRGTYNEEVKLWSHEIDFWGGTLAGVAEQLDYVESLGVDVLYLNPIHEAYTNHKYDAFDYFAVSPEYGTRDDVVALAATVNERGMRLVLDGVFNHMGAQSPAFQEALANPDSPWREWFYIGDEYELGYRAWYDVHNLPEIDLENPAVRARLWGDPDSVIQGYLRDGVSGWRLDVAFDIGFAYLEELTRSSREARPDSLIIGEIWNYPEEWSPGVDGVMNMTGRQLIIDLVNHRVSAPQAARLFDTMIEDAGMDHMLKAWIILDNHDTPRLRTILPEPWQQRMAQVLQFTLPGSPCVYYGVELGMEGGDDPEQRGPMRWDLVRHDNEYLTWTRRLIALRSELPSLRHGDFRLLPSENLLAFQRRTTRVAETAVVLVNPSDEPATDLLIPRESKFMSYMDLEDVFTGTRFKVISGTLPVTVPPRTAMVLRPITDTARDYTPFKRVR
jgi:glycosidase